MQTTLLSRGIRAAISGGRAVLVEGPVLITWRSDHSCAPPCLMCRYVAEVVELGLDYRHRRQMLRVEPGDAE